MDSRYQIKDAAHQRHDNELIISNSGSSSVSSPPNNENEQRDSVVVLPSFGNSFGPRANWDFNQRFNAQTFGHVHGYQQLFQQPTPPETITLYREESVAEATPIPAGFQATGSSFLASHRQGQELTPPQSPPAPADDQDVVIKKNSHCEPSLVVDEGKDNSASAQDTAIMQDNHVTFEQSTAWNGISPSPSQASLPPRKRRLRSCSKTSQFNASFSGQDAGNTFKVRRELERILFDTNGPYRLTTGTGGAQQNAIGPLPPVHVQVNEVDTRAGRKRTAEMSNQDNTKIPHLSNGNCMFLNQGLTPNPSASTAPAASQNPFGSVLEAQAGLSMLTRVMGQGVMMIEMATKERLEKAMANAPVTLAPFLPGPNAQVHTPVITGPVSQPNHSNAAFGQVTTRRYTRRKTSTDPLKDQQLDIDYLERRRQNNLAARRSRDARKAKDAQIAQRLFILERENAILKAQMAFTIEQYTRLRQMVAANIQAQAEAQFHSVIVDINNNVQANHFGMPQQVNNLAQAQVQVPILNPNRAMPTHTYPDPNPELGSDSDYSA